MQFDLVIVGAGPVGCVIAERAAKIRGWTSLIIEKRGHVAGNCHDAHDENGILLHKYGPHYFRTNSEKLYEYLSQFTEWIPGNYYVKSFSRGEYFNFPINLNTLEQFFKVTLTPEQAMALLESKRLKIANPKNSEEFVLSRVGRELYEAFYLGYTKKQWGIHPRELAPSVCGRIPIRTNRNDKYVDHRFQIIPKLGYTHMFSKMLVDKKIRVMLNTDYKAVKKNFIPKIATVYCGPIDEFFDFRHGKLGWRSLRFEFVTKDQEFVQPCVQINYPNEFEYTRTVEIKHVTGQHHPKTVISQEYSMATGDPYYPLPNPENAKLYQEYLTDAEVERRTNKIYFSGRLATYSYINTDEAIEMGLNTFEKISAEAAHG